MIHQVYRGGFYAGNRAWAELIEYFIKKLTLKKSFCNPMEIYCIFKAN